MASVERCFFNQTDAAKVIITGFSSLKDKTVHGKDGIEVDFQILSRDRYWNRCATQLNGKRGRQLREFLMCAY